MTEKSQNLPTHYLRSGSSIRVVSGANIDICDGLPLGNYIVQFDKQSGEYYLEKVGTFTSLPPKLYGNVFELAARIVNTFQDRDVSTGVLLTGEKGSGKTMLSKVISAQLATIGISTIIINECMHGDLFNKFIQMIDSSCAIIFDEFEKVYPTEHQEKILTLLDGVFPTKKLFLFTCNSANRINHHMMNRPGRIFYVLKYAGLDGEYIKQYCMDNLNNKDYIDEICRLSLLFAAFNFDMLKALVEDMNRYNESPTEVMKLLNAIPEDSGSNSFDVELSIGGKLIAKDNLDDAGTWCGNPLDPRGVQIEYRNPQYKDDDNSNYWSDVTVFSNHLVNVNIESGTFEYNDGTNVVKLKRSKIKSYQYAAF